MKKHSDTHPQSAGTAPRKRGRLQGGPNQPRTNRQGSDKPAYNFSAYPVLVCIFNDAGVTEEFLATGPTELLGQLEGFEGLLPFGVRVWSGPEGPDWRKAAMLHPTSNMEELLYAAVDLVESLNRVRLLGEACTSTDADLLAILATHWDVQMRGFTAANPHLPTAVLDAMETDREPMIRRLVALFTTDANVRRRLSSEFPVAAARPRPPRDFDARLAALADA